MRLIFASAVVLATVVSAAVVRAGEHDFNSNGVKIHYLVEGKGEPVVLIHGFGRNAEWIKNPGPTHRFQR